jgi:hypothetical protein
MLLLALDTTNLAPEQAPASPAGFRRFTVVGGYTDTYSFLAHGHVFANARPENVVFRLFNRLVIGEKKNREENLERNRF